MVILEWDVVGAQILVVNRVCGFCADEGVWVFVLMR